MPQPNTSDYTDYFGVLNTDGELAAVATMNAAIGSISINYKTAATSATTTTALTALASATTAHTDNRAFAIAPGNLRVDFPDAPWASGASFVEAWLTFSGGLAGYETAGGTKRIPLSYGLQNPDAGATELARSSEIDDVDTALGTIGTNAATAATQSTTAATQATTAATQSTTAATQATTAATQSTTAATQSTAAAASAAAVQAKLPTASAKIAGEGATAKNLDQVTVSATEVILETITDGTMPDSTTVRIDDTNDRSNLVGYQIAIGTYLRTITGYTAYVAEPETPASFSIDVAISPSVVNGTLVQVFSRATGSVVLTEENIDDIADAVAAQVTGGTVAAITDDVLAQHFIPFGRATDGWYRSERPVRIALGSPALIAADTRKWGSARWGSMDAPTIDDTDVATVGSVANSTYGISTVKGTPAFVLTPVAAGTAEVTVEGIVNGQGATLVFDVVVAEP